MTQQGPQKHKPYLHSAESNKAKRAAIIAMNAEPIEAFEPNIKLDYEKFEQHEKDAFEKLSKNDRHVCSIIVDNLPLVGLIEEEY